MLAFQCSSVPLAGMHVVRSSIAFACMQFLLRAYMQSHDFEKTGLRNSRSNDEAATAAMVMRKLGSVGAGTASIYLTASQTGHIPLLSKWTKTRTQPKST